MFLHAASGGGGREMINHGRAEAGPYPKNVSGRAAVVLQSTLSSYVNAYGGKLYPYCEGIEKVILEKQALIA
jgi:hypothetical protein